MAKRREESGPIPFHWVPDSWRKEEGKSSRELFKESCAHGDFWYFWILGGLFCPLSILDPFWGHFLPVPHFQQDTKEYGT